MGIPASAHLLWVSLGVSSGELTELRKPVSERSNIPEGPPAEPCEESTRSLPEMASGRDLYGTSTRRDVFVQGRVL